MQKFSSNEPVGVVNTDLFTVVSIQEWDGSSYNVLVGLLNHTVEEERL